MLGAAGTGQGAAGTGRQSKRETVQGGRNGSLALRSSCAIQQHAEAQVLSRQGCMHSVKQLIQRTIVPCGTAGYLALRDATLSTCSATNKGGSLGLENALLQAHSASTQCTAQAHDAHPHKHHAQAAPLLSENLHFNHLTFHFSCNCMGMLLRGHTISKRLVNEPDVSLSYQETPLHRQPTDIDENRCDSVRKLPCRPYSQ